MEFLLKTLVKKSHQLGEEKDVYFSRGKVALGED
jgi:hypothetical protein